MADNSEPETALPLDLPQHVEAGPPRTDAEVIDDLRTELHRLLVEYEDLATVAGGDVRAICIALGLGDHPRPYSVHELVQREVLPAIGRAMALLPPHLSLAQGAGKSEDVKAAGLTGIPELDLGNGRKARLAGRRLPDKLARQMGLKP